MEDRKEKIYREMIEDAEKTKTKPRNGRNYAYYSIFLGIIGFFLPSFIALFTGIVSIVCAKIAIENKEQHLGRIGGIIGFASILWFFLSVINLGIFRF